MRICLSAIGDLAEPKWRISCELLGDQSARIIVRNHIQGSPLGLRYPNLR